MSKLVPFLCLFLSGCIIVMDEDCDPESVDYSHTEYDCYLTLKRVRVCDDYYCWNESREVQVCDDIHVCYDRGW